MLLSRSEKVQGILQKVVEWASDRPKINVAVLMGSWARQTARLDSDIDFMFLVAEPSYFRNEETWLSEIDWKSIGCELNRWQDKGYSMVWSRHVDLSETT